MPQCKQWCTVCGWALAASFFSEHQAFFCWCLVGTCPHQPLAATLLNLLLAVQDLQAATCMPMCLQLLLLVHPELSVTQLRAILAYLHAWSRGCPHGLLSLKQLLMALRSLSKCILFETVWLSFHIRCKYASSCRCSIDLLVYQCLCILMLSDKIRSGNYCRQNVSISLQSPPCRCGQFLAKKMHMPVNPGSVNLWVTWCSGCHESS